MPLCIALIDQGCHFCWAVRRGFQESQLETSAALHPKTPTHRVRHNLGPPCPGGVQGGGAAERLLPPREYWWDLPMEAPKEEDSGPSGLGAFGYILILY